MAFSKADLLRYMRGERLAVVSTLGPDGAPQSALVGFAATNSSSRAAAAYKRKVRAPPVAFDADRDDHRHRDDPAVAPRLHVGRVQPDIGPVAFQGAFEDGFDLFVDLPAQARDLAPRLGSWRCRSSPSP